MSAIESLRLHSPALIIAIPLLTAFIIPLLSKIIGPKARNGFVVAVLTGVLALVLLLAHDVITGGTRTYVLGGSTPLLTLPSGYQVPVRIMFVIDAMGVFMGIMCGVIALVAAIYSCMETYEGLYKFYTLLLLVTTGIFGLVFTGDLFNLFVFFEILSIASCGLVAFKIDSPMSMEGGFKYMVISDIGGLSLLVMIGLLYGQYDALNIGMLANRMDYGMIDIIALGLIVTALLMKSGSVPMHMWTPDAYGETPSSVTIMIVGASLSSLYALFRICFTLYGGFIGINVAGWIIVILALISILVGVTMAIPQTDFKRLIGYAAVAEIGFILLGLGAGLASLSGNSVDAYGIKAMEGSIFHIFNDALDIGLLFFVAAVVSYATGQRNLNNLCGLGRKMKYTTFLFIIGLAAVAGLPPMNGFASKFLIYESVFHLNPILAIIGILGSIMMLAIFVKAFSGAFLGPPVPELETYKKVPRSMLFAMSIVVAIIVFFGLFPDLIVDNLAHPAAQALANHSEYISHAIRIGGV